MPKSRGAQWSQMCLLLYTLLFWLTGFALIFLALWALFDPRRNYVLELVHLSENDPLLKAAVYVCLLTGSLILVVGFIACCGAIKRSRCMLVTFMIFLVIILCAELTIGVLAIRYRSKFSDGAMNVYVSDLVHERYNRVYWVTPLVDAIQYYQQCCGGSSPRDYYESYWFKTNTVRGTRSFVPASCCKQTQNARSTAIQPIDPMCTTYAYFSSPFNNSVNVQVIGMCVAMSLYRHAHAYHRYVRAY